MMKNLKIFPCIYITCNRYKVSNGKALPPFTAESLTTNFNLLTADFLLLTADLICWKFEIFAYCWLHSLTTSTDMQLLTTNFNMLTSSKLLCREEETNYRCRCTNRVYFSYLNNDGDASFCCWDTKIDAFYVHTIGSNVDVPGTL